MAILKLISSSPTTSGLLPTSLILGILSGLSPALLLGLAGADAYAHHHYHRIQMHVGVDREKEGPGAEAARVGRRWRAVPIPTVRPISVELNKATSITTRVVDYLGRITTRTRYVGYDIIYNLCFSGAATLDRNNSWDPGEDYRILRNGVAITGSNCVSGLTIEAGSTTPPAASKVSIEVRPDDAFEPHERVVITPTITSGEGYAYAGAYTIVNDDLRVVENPQVTIDMTGDAVNEGQAAYFRVRIANLPGTTSPPGRALHIKVAARLPWTNEVWHGVITRTGIGTEWFEVPPTYGVSGDYHMCAWVRPGNGYTIGGTSGDAPSTTTDNRPTLIDDDGGRVHNPAYGTRVNVNDGKASSCPSGHTVLVRDTAPRTPPIERSLPLVSPKVSFDSGTYSVTEGGTVSITVSIDVERPTATTVPINYTDVSAVSSHSSFNSQRRVTYGQDYEASPAEVVIPAEAGGSHTFIVQTVDDSATVVQEEGNETFRVSLGELPAGIGKGSPSTATVTIVDDDVRDDPALRVTSITRDLPSVSPTAFDSLTWRVTFSEDVRNVDKSDFRLSGTTATLSTSSTGGPSIYKVVASGGDLADLNGTVVLGFASNRNIVASNNGGKRLVNTRPTGANEDHFVMENIAESTVIITGGTAITKGGNAVFTLTANPAPPSPLTVMVTVTQTGNVVASNSLLGSKTVIIPPSGSMTHTVATKDDTGLEENGRVTVTVDESFNYTVGNPSSASVTVNDSTSPSPSPSPPPPTTPTITIRSGNPNPITEGAGANFTVTATPPPLSPLNVTVTVTQTGDFVASGNLSSQTVTIPPSGSMTHTVATVNDNIPEANGMVRVTVSQGTGYTVGSLASAAVRVNDDDDGTSPPPTAPTVTIMGGPSPITEGTAAAFTVSRSGPVTAPLPVLLRVRETTTGGQDFVATAQEGVKTVTIPSGAATAPYTVTTVDDNTDEPDGMVTVTLNSSSAYLVGSPSAAAVNVNDDDGGSPAPPSPAVTPVVSITGGGGITEGQAATFTVTAVPAPPPGEPISVNVAISDSGNFARPGQSGSRSVTIDNSGMARFTVSTQDDAIHEDHGRITATVEGGSGYTPHASNGSASVRVEDDDPALMLSVSRLRVTEGGSASYTIALDTRPSGDVTVAISGDAATDLTLTPTSLTFTPSNWDRHQRVTITAPEDTDFLGDTIDLTHTASGPNYGGITATVTATVVAAHSTEEAKAWQLRLGRTVSHQVVDALEDRLSARPAAGLQLTVAGEAIVSAPPLAEHEGLLSKALGFDPLTAQALAEDSSFSFAPEQEGAAPRLAFWGQGAFSSFRGEEEDLSLDGSVTTLLLGADWSRQRWQAGAALSQSWGNGSYESEGDGAEGEITSTVTGLFPYGRYALTPRLGLWAVAGYGWGQLSLNPDGPGDDATPSTTMGMAALGMDGLLFDGGNEGITLSSTADVLTLKTTSEEVDGLESSEGSLSRLRLGIEAVRPFPLSNGASLLPSLALGIRQDSGDAETGFGLDLGAGILWQAPERGISGALRGHTLLAHGEEDFQEQGLALSFSWAPNPSNRGPSLSLNHAMGATAAGGMDALLNPITFEGLDADPSSGQRFEAELAYGFPAHNNQLTLTPAVALALSPTSRNYSLLWSLVPYAEPAQGEPWQLSLAGERQEPNTTTSPVDHSLKLRFSTLF